MRILYVTASQAYFTNNVYDFDHSFSQYSKHDLFYFDISKNAFDIDLHAFDAILFSYSFLAHTDKFSHSLTKKINKFTGLKIPVLQDDYLYFLKHRDNLAAFGINAIVTIVPPQYWDKVFFGPFAHLPKLQVLTGYVTENMERQFSERLPLNARKWKIGYRSRNTIVTELRRATVYCPSAPTAVEEASTPGKYCDTNFWARSGISSQASLLHPHTAKATSIKNRQETCFISLQRLPSPDGSENRIISPPDSPQAIGRKVSRR